MKIYVKENNMLVNAAHQSVDYPKVIQLAEINAPRSDLKTLEREYAKDGLSGDALYQKINDDMFNFGCFVAGTLITTDKGKVPIQDIKVGDLVLSKPEDGIGEPEFKPVLKTFVHEEKPIWMVRARRSPNFFDSQGEEIDYQKYKLATEAIDFLATPNHPVWVIGISNANRDITFYERPHWKRVDELLQYEHAVNADGVMYYITDVQPLYRFSHPDVEPNPNHYWYEKNYGKDYYDDYLHGDFEPDLEVTEEDFKTVGYVKNVGNYNECGLLGRFVKNNLGDVELTNSLRDTNGQFIPFTTTVYNMEVAENHTYFVNYAKLWVHNTDCEEKALKILLGDALYQKINDDMFNFGCFVAGTLVTTDKGKVPIQDIKVGDLVLSKPEDGIGEPEFKPVLKTFVHEEKPIWMVRARRSPNFFDSQGEEIDYQKYKLAREAIDFLATPNHPVWVIGISNANRDITFYERPHWKRVDELLQYEHAVNADGVMYYITDVQPLYRFSHPDVEPNPNHYWYEKNYGKDYYDDYLYGDFEPDLEVTEEDFKTVGYVKNVGNYNECGLLGRFVKNSLGDVELTNSLRDTNGQFIPFTTTVYNMEVAENHTYFIDDAKLWVHNTDCENKTTKALTGKETVDILLEYQDVLREAATGQVTKSVYMP